MLSQTLLKNVWNLFKGTPQVATQDSSEPLSTKVVDEEEEDAQSVDTNIEEEDVSTIHDPFKWLNTPQILAPTDNAHNVGDGAAEEIARYTRSATKKLHHHQYTVGWICALPKELTAAKVMLDEMHVPLPNSPGDYNTYQLGSIGSHNVVIACLRSGVYGTTSAAAVAIAMRTTYPNSNIMPLMVGIGGGVPSFEDIRLGDVVISTPSPEYPAVRQYDHGKRTRNGELEITGSLNKPGHALLGALSHFQAELAINPSKASDNISLALSNFSLQGFAYPGTDQDILFKSECKHIQDGPDCHDCPARRIHRKARPDSHPVIHFGSIGSGNQVIKHSQTRDRLAKRYRILCFEMEAAGVMDYLPCLVIRGISDYCDGFKNKEFQAYAALAAAAVAKEFLCQAQATQLEAQDAAGQVSEVTKRQGKLDVMGFKDSRTRQATVRNAHPQTCGWLLQQPEINDWMDRQTWNQHHGMLWIKGKPGAGKSTVMKYLANHTLESCLGNNTAVTISFFFSARGSELVRSTIGMYRSLLEQIFLQLPVLQSLLDRLDSSFNELQPIWTVELLEDLLRRVVQGLGNYHLICFVDALDECPEEQVRTMVAIFEAMSELARPNGFHVCFSSRHYPNISIKRGNSFVLESQDGHSDDLINYLDAELILGDEHDELVTELRGDVYRKSGEIFLWVVLVVQIIREQYDRGQVHNLRKIVEKIPERVEDLFRDMLTRDKVDLPQLVKAIQWVLYAKRPLGLLELYHALLCFESSFTLHSNTEILASQDDMKRFVLHYSKGLMEVTASDTPSVQFIHETIRTFLLESSSLITVWPGFGNLTEGTSHDLLAGYCSQYIEAIYTTGSFLSDSPELSKWLDSDVKEQEAVQKFPLLRYSLHHMLDHANAAERLGIPQTVLLNKIEHGTWPEYYDRFVSYPLRFSVMLPLVIDRRRRPQFPTGLGFVLGVLGQVDLLIRWCKKDKDNGDYLLKIAPHLIGQLLTVNDATAYKMASWIIQLIAKNNNIDTEIIAAILRLLQNLPIEHLLYDDRAAGLMLTLLSQDFEISETEGIEALSYAVESRSPTAIELFRDHGVCDAKVADKALTTLMHKYELPPAELSELPPALSMPHLNSSEMAYISRIRTILAIKMCLVNPEINKEQVLEGHMATVPKSIRGEIAKFGKGRFDTEYIESLLSLGFGVNLSCKESRDQTPLHAAAECGNTQVVQRLLAHNANIEAKDGRGLTALAYVVRQKNHDLTNLLLLNRASLYTPDHRGITPLARAFTAGGVDMKTLPDKFVTTSNDYTVLCSLYDNSFRTVAELSEFPDLPEPWLLPRVPLLSYLDSKGDVVLVPGLAELPG